MQVNIAKRIDTPKGKRYCSVVAGLNGRIKPIGLWSMSIRKSIRKTATTSIEPKTESVRVFLSAMMQPLLTLARSQTKRAKHARIGPHRI